jgi:hypothetical protein
LPVPSSKREVNARPAITRGSLVGVAGMCSLRPNDPHEPTHDAERFRPSGDHVPP